MTTKRIASVVLIPALVLLHSSMPSVGQDAALTAPAGDGEIAKLIRDLSHPSYEKRMSATRRLCVVGMSAYDRLEGAAAGDDVERALRAQDVLATLQQLCFAGVEVSLAFSKTKIAWDESVDLTISFDNLSSYPARVPFDIDPAARARVGGDARQVADILDLAEWLRILDPNGREVALRINDIAADPAVDGVVQERATGDPFAVLPPHQRVTITVTAFNRGWARFPLLERGTYRAVLDYMPAWRDRALADARVGRVVSKPATVEVTTAAPAAVSRGGLEASILAVLEQGFVIARWMNRSDQTALINTNFGSSPPLAQGRWICEHGSIARDLRLGDQAGATWQDFDPVLVREVEPGQSIELARISVNELKRRLLDARLDQRAREWEVYFSYANLCDLRWQQSQGTALLGNPQAPPFLRKPLPLRLRAGWHSSNRVAVHVGE